MVSLSRAAPQIAIDRPERTLAGIAMVLAAMVLFSGMDGISKILARDYHPIEISCLRFFFTVLLLIPLALRAPVPVWRTTAPLLQLGRGLCMVGSSVLFIFGLSGLPIADASAIGFASPLLVTALSIPFLGEKVGMRRWAAVVTGFTGVLIVVRPGTGAFNPAAAFPLLSACSWAMGLILTRRMRHGDPVLTTMLYSAAIGLAAGSLVLPFIWKTPSAGALMLLALTGGLNA
ncbi:MAG: DMT family transporter, partial [Alphaproteobacteria bacterium]|nr:DMT family transporter [Alphaproteobacteria bacterium]